MGATLVVLAAGIGSRFGGVKQIQPVDDEGQAIIDYSVFDARRAGFNHVVFVIRKEIEADFRRFAIGRFAGLDVEIACQELSDLPPGYAVPADRKKPWGTGQAVLITRAFVRQPFAVINADDFYGREAYSVLFEFLARQPQSAVAYALVGYVLEKTLSEHGTVSRGVCEVDDAGRLISISEQTKIARESGRVTSRQSDGTVIDLSGNETVSMNLFGFTPSIFGQLEELFSAFLSARGADPSAEFYIPAAANELIRSDRASMTVLRSTSEWFGVTYREDIDVVVSRIAEMRRAGLYPSSLWA
ncbi:MAG TPA: NTP transferase domain-containing protein [Spirochaetia bacterium]|nr:NTP transferase domain-containing protein [Spirochaetia bacterium]